MGDKFARQREEERRKRMGKKKGPLKAQTTDRRLRKKEYC